MRAGYLGLVVFLLASLLSACHQGQLPTLAAAAPPILTAQKGTGSTPRLPTRIASQTPSATPSVSATPLPSRTATPTPTPTEPPTVRHLRIFDQLYQLVLDNYLYPDYNGLNWPAWGMVTREQIAAGMTDAGFYQVLTELVAKLGDAHSVFQSPAAANLTRNIIHGNHTSVGIGADLSPRPENGSAVLLEVYPAGPAWNAGLRPHDRILLIDGHPALEGLWRLDGSAGSTLELSVQSPGQMPRQVALLRAPVNSPAPVTVSRWQESGIVIILVRTFWDQNTASILRHRLQEVGDQAPIEGIIIDLRTNRGGSEYNLEGTLSLFTDGTLGFFARRNSERPLAVIGESIHDSQNLPLIILIGRDTSSYAEIFAGVLQSVGRARLLGTVTEGNVETIWPHSFEDGSRLWLAEEGFRPLHGGNWEQDGVVPDYYVPGDWADFTAENDPQLGMALELLSPERGQ